MLHDSIANQVLVFLGCVWMVLNKRCPFLPFGLQMKPTRRAQASPNQAQILRAWLGCPSRCLQKMMGRTISEPCECMQTETADSLKVCWNLAGFSGIVPKGSAYLEFHKPTSKAAVNHKAWTRVTVRVNHADWVKKWRVPPIRKVHRCWQTVEDCLQSWESPCPLSSLLEQM